MEYQGETVICLRDPAGFVEEPVVLTPAAFFIASLLDGVNGITDIQYHFVNHTGGHVLPAEHIETVVETLDRSGFLMTERFEAIFARVTGDYAQAPVRPAYLAGKGYPDDPESLHAYLDALFEREGGPGAFREAAAGSAPPVRCLISPHIDFERGALGYAHAYARLARGSRPDTALLFGVAHSGAPVPFVLSRKGYATPFGTIEANREMVERLAGAASWDPFEHEIAHRTEHSLEFQAVMLGHQFGTGTRIVPILCGGLAGGEDLDSGVEEVMAGFLGTCRELVIEGNGAVIAIAGADLAHVGRRFGDPFEIDDAVIARIHERDRQDLAFAMSGDAAGWYRSVTSDANERRVCGLNCIYAALRCVEGLARQGEILHYGEAPDPAGGLVSFAAAALY